jgi:type I restriction enzyme M protein
VESHLWEAANILRGPVDASDFKSFIFPILFFKRISDVYDEEYQVALSESGGEIAYAPFAENHRFQIPEGCHWNDVRATTTNVGQAIQRSLREIEKANPDQLFGIFGDAQWTNTDRLPDAMLKDLVEHFSTLTLSIANVSEDELGNSYEFLIKKFAAHRCRVLHEPHVGSPDDPDARSAAQGIHLRSDLRQRRHVVELCGGAEAAR